jgi:predicted metalloprotease with PDZ domain
MSACVTHGAIVSAPALKLHVAPMATTTSSSNDREPPSCVRMAFTVARLCDAPFLVSAARRACAGANAKAPTMRFFAVLAIGIAAFLATPATAQTAPENVAIDASDVARGVVHVKMTIPATAGPLTLVYPKWLPGEHGPNGPINELVALRITANGARVPWQRDLVDLYAFHLTVPQGTSALSVSMDYLLAAGTFSSKERTTTARVAMLTPYAFVLYPQGAKNTEVHIASSLTVPENWDFATALIAASRDGRHTTFEPVTLETFNDSPLLMGENFRKITLDTKSGIAELDVAAETPEELAASDETIAKYKKLIAEADAEYGARHWRNYHFLLVLSDAIDYNGIEHHESSDDRGPENFLTDSDSIEFHADLLPHEFTHSWNGKYRRPYDLQVENFQDPERTDLLWVYEGLTEYLGNVLASRSGLRSPAAFADVIAAEYADLDVTTGRLTRPLLDTATDASWLYFGTPQFAHARRGTDFYPESMMMWLEADSVIREHSGGKKSLDDFVRAFYGPPSTGPRVVTYTREDVVAALNAVAPYDWATFFRTRVDEITTHPPAAGFEADGWRLAYTSEPTAFMRERERFNKQIVALYSLGATIAEDGAVVDVIDGSPAAKAGIAPYQRVLAVGGRRFTPDALHAAIKATATSNAPMSFVIDNFGAVSTVNVVYHGGERYPRLERIPGKPDLLTPIASPRT